MAGGTRTCETNMEKLHRPSRRAWYTAMAFGAAVVSNPMPKNTTCFDGLARAILRALTSKARCQARPAAKEVPTVAATMTPACLLTSKLASTLAAMMATASPLVRWRKTHNKKRCIRQ